MTKVEVLKDSPKGPRKGAYLEYRKETGFWVDSVTKENWALEPLEYPEFFRVFTEEKPEYEILEFCSSYPRGFVRMSNGTFKAPAKKSIKAEIVTEEELLKKEGKIIKVRRTSDDVIFTVGDKVCDIYDKNVVEILSFKEDPSRSFICVENPKITGYYDKSINLGVIEHYKEPLFTTEDGVEIFEGNENVEVYYCHRNGFKLYNCCKKEIKPGSFSVNNLYFSTKEAAEEYILMNKPVLSLIDINEVVPKLTTESWLRLKKKAKENIEK